jgi:hypothetical protein
MGFVQKEKKKKKKREILSPKKTWYHPLDNYYHWVSPIPNFSISHVKYNF